jgi:tetratricopeptide (TPR) repeat protein
MNGRDLIARAAAASERGDHVEARRLAQEAVQELEGEHAVGALLLLGRTHQTLGEHDAAEDAFQQAGEVVRGLAEGVETVRLKVRTLEALAGLRGAEGRYYEAEPLFREALALAESTLGSDVLEVADLANGLAVTFKFSGRFDEAEELYRRALSVLERALGPEHPDVASIYHNLGGLEHARGNFAEAEPFARRSVEIREAAVAPDHPDLAADRAALAAILDAAGKHDEAEALLRQALAVFEPLFGP